MASKHGWKVELIPWDPLSPEHVQRMYIQRVACGWRAEEVPSWVETAKKGGKIFYWIILSDAFPDKEKMIEKHIGAYPEESTPLRDTAAQVRLVPRQPTTVEFIPIGHVAVDIHEPEEDRKMDLPTPGTVWLHQLYISRALHGAGLGAGATSKIEELVTRDPLNAKVVALDTLSREMQTDPELRNVLYGEGSIPAPAIANEDWYISQGYQVHRREKGAYIWKESNTAVNLVYMKKVVA